MCMKKGFRGIYLMLMILSVWLLAVPAGASSPFTDPNLEAAVREALDVPTAPLTTSMLVSLPFLNASESNIASLSGIEQCTSLQTLIVNDNLIESVEPLRTLPWLSLVNLENNLITDISPLLANTAISDIDLIGNPLSVQAVCTDIDLLVARGATVAYLEDDRDSDGLYICEEAANDTDPANPDTDGDGISDGYEVVYGLNPLDAADAPEDPDADGLTNLDESYLRSDPFDATDPYSTVWVATSGTDTANGGSVSAPWRTIQYAVDHVVCTSAHPATILVAQGTYAETVVLRPYVRLQGDAAEITDVIVEGTITAAADASLFHLTVSETAGKSDSIILLTLDNAAMAVHNVIFQGAASSQATGAVLRGNAPGNAVLSDCTFKGLHRGMEIFGALPTIVRCVFQDISEHGIIIRQTTAKAAKSGSLGSATDANTGWNTFQNITGYDVVNERSQAVTMERNNWGTATPAAKISGNVDYDPPLAQGSPLVPASVVCNVWDAATLNPVSKGTMRVTPGSFSPVSGSATGVYTLACLATGSYGLNVSASGYHSGSRTVSTVAGEITAIVMPIKSTETSEGEGEGEGEGDDGEGEGEGEHHSCVGGMIDATPPSGPWHTGDGWVLAALVSVLAASAWGLRWRKA